MRHYSNDIEMILKCTVKFVKLTKRFDNFVIALRSGGCVRPVFGSLPWVAVGWAGAFRTLGMWNARNARSRVSEI